MSDIVRLRTTLLTTGLQQKDQPLYQLLYQLINELNGVSDSVSTSVVISNTPGPQGPAGPPGFLSFDDSGGDGGDITLPGPRGIDGANGMVPYFIALSEVFVIPLYKQALFEMNIDNEGILEVNGFLIEV